MTIAMQPIYTQTVGAGGTYAFTFNNIPQYFTDLVLDVSTRDTFTPSPNTNGVDNYMWFNGNSGTTLYSSTRLYGTGSGAGGDRLSNSGYIAPFLTTNPTSTANTFGTARVTIPNYASSNFKSFICEGVSETNGTVAWQTLIAGLFRSTSAITSLTFSGQTALAQYSTATLYGITKG